MAPKKKEATGDLMISTAEYKKTRDSVIASLHNLQAGLIHVQHGITDLLSNYRKHCASVLGDEESEAPFSDFTTNTQSLADGVRAAADELKQAIAPVENAADANKGKKRKREKKEKDPNAPKKPLTAAFLYAQSARPIVKADLEAALPSGAIMEKNAVQTEVNKRWAELPEENKEQWKAQYRKNLEEYKINLAEYLAKKAEIEVGTGAVDSDVSDDEEEAPTKAPSPPAKTPRKRQKTAPAVNGNTLPIHIAPATVSTPKDSKKKKEKSVPQPIAPAPPAVIAEEPTPEEAGGKKKKSSRSTREEAR
ncbi:NHP6B Chromatin-associated protein containing the HMG domain protein [Pyrenophora tritici-repentis]|nr:NHP6B Chromatin-associated protein containing the HMG domain protein [Pyrenophora tritici-repentis]KAI0585939.1 NHP6B Chromatin-associated protein containing the HMG domain protein [Pyrenophora tritici-repentis]KAI0609521.1 NHP6B Chromatin-associated protein containing the HMG domain protein [Pyrenophora tritici-repentis]PZD31042.1 NHP6B, Chromatin-associated protein containing the HMG domain protein [Pyrenophora tritici-repentis]